MPTILAVDDEDDLLERVAYNLEVNGLRVAPAASGRAALRAVKGGPPVLVVLDVMLPDLQGFEVLRRLRTREAT